MTAESESAQDEAQQYAEQAEEAAEAGWHYVRFQGVDVLMPPKGVSYHPKYGVIDTRKTATREQAEEKDALADLQRRYGTGPTRQGGTA